MTRSELPLSVRKLEHIDQLCLQFENEWQNGSAPDIQSFLRRIDETARESLLVELILLENDYLERQGKKRTAESWNRRLPNEMPAVSKAFSIIAKKPSGVTEKTKVTMGSCLQGEPLFDSEHITDRYVLLDKIGAGAFAVVYRANDQSLKREVAVKIPHQTKDENYDLEQVLAEARMLARLDHPAIVPVYDIGRTGDGRIYIVTKLISGISLEALLDQQSIDVEQSLDIMLQTAKALDHAHQRGLIHRDLKPSNLLLDSQGQVYITDFGLALDLYSPNSNRFVGTPAYMSPEQASGESHLVDHRSDIFSLGAIFYQLLTGKRPFDGGGTARVLDRVRKGQAISVSRLNTNVDREVERICMKAMTPQIMHRYGSVKDIAREIEQYLNGSTNSRTALFACESSVLPKGLNSFDCNDASGFIQLLAGPRDRSGLPESLSFWKRRIESRDPDTAFRVGLLSGPSGSGKSSLVKAGLLPHLNDDVHCITLETEPIGTEDRLLAKLHLEFPDLADCQSLVDAMARLRQSDRSGKCLIVLDQFEQWLSAHSESEQLVKALRQCDGTQLQCLLIVRDDFGMATTRLMQQLDSKIEQGRNFSSVDLFTKEHARNILARFAEALDKRSVTGNEFTADDEFIVQAVERLAEDGHVVAVKLSLFADLVRERDWDRRILDSFGSLTDIGTSFLDEHLAESASHPIAKKHRHSIQEILETLLVSRFEQIKGGAVSLESLAVAAGIKQNQYEFAELLDFLENQLRLISRVETNALELTTGKNKSELNGTSQKVGVEPHAKTTFQLTHDFLVPSVRKWLVDQKRSTRRGRINLLFQQLATWWNNEPVNRRLPSQMEWLQIHTLVPRRTWTQMQCRMMAAANQFYFRYLLFIMVALTLLGVATWNWAKHQRATNLVSQIKISEPRNLSSLLRQLPSVQQRALRLLDVARKDAVPETNQKLCVLTAIHACDGSVPSELVDELLVANAGELSSLAQLLMPRRKSLVRELETRLKLDNLDANGKTIAAGLLAQFESENDVFQQPQDEVVANLLGQNAVNLPYLVRLLSPVKDHLRDELLAYFEDDANPTSQRSSATVLAGLYQNQPEKLVPLVESSTVEQLKVLLPFLSSDHGQLSERLRDNWEEYLDTAPLLKLGISEERKQQLQVVTGASRDWLLANRVPKSEFDDLNQMIRQTGLKLVARVPYADNGDFLTAIWGRGFNNESKQISPPELSDEFEFSVGQFGAKKLPDRYIDIYLRKNFSDSGSLSRFLKDTRWDDQIVAAGGAPYGLLRSVHRLELPRLKLSQLTAFTAEAWVYKWSGPIFSLGKQVEGEDSIWMEIARENDRTYSFGWTRGQGKQQFVNQFRRREPKLLNHVALVFDGKNQKFFLNGKLIHEKVAEWVGEVPIDRPLRLGMREQGNSPKWGTGQIVSLKISSTAQYTNEFVPDEKLQRDSQTVFQLSTRQSEPKKSVVRKRTIEIRGIDLDQQFSAGKTLASIGYVPVTASQKPSSRGGSNWASRWKMRYVTTPTAEREKFRQMNSAIALWELGHSDSILPALMSSEDNTVRTRLIVDLSKIGPEPRKLLKAIGGQSDSVIRQGLVLIMSRLSNQALPISLRNELLPEFLRLYGHESQGNVKAAIGQLLDRWGASAQRRKSDAELKYSISANQSWKYSPQGQLMSIVSSPPHANSVAKKLAVSVHELTNLQFDEYEKYRDPNNKTNFRQRDWQQYPRRGISWFEAAKYCNWLSSQDGLPEDQWCFLIDGDKVEIPDDYLERTGYRIPTIAEWQFVAAAKAKTPFCFGSDENHLPYFAWSSGNSEHGPRPVGQLLPNAFGLFDVHGNVREWVVSLQKESPVDRFDTGYVCGGSYGHSSPLMHLDSIHTNPLRSKSVNVGLRVVKSMD